MKLAEPTQPNRTPGSRRKGVALVTVLTVMALTTILVLTFFSLATSEHRASHTYSHGLHAQQVAEQAVNMVIAQIREATVRPRTEQTRAWASQPGAIRTWLFNGQQADAYKLYSDDMMKVSGAQWGEFLSDFQDARNWSSRPEHFVDLNEPVIRGQKVYYPIAHPTASVLPVWPQQAQPQGNRKRMGVEGFGFNEGEFHVIEDEGPLGRQAANLAGAPGHLAMPVRWLYQLADGTIGVLQDGGSGGSGGGGSGPAFRFQAISGQGIPSSTNPMVSRFAFWADDETAKLNLNTHAGGLAWDIPKAGGELDMDMAKHQPAQKEWQRYPGHPATTHLIPALAPGVMDIVNDRDAMEMLFRIVPRVVGGGSMSGTRVINTRDPAEMNGLVPDTDPLFPSVEDIMLMSQNYRFYGRRPPGGISAADRAHHEFPNAQGDPIPYEELAEHLERSKFFLTVNSRAPETNLYNLPRIAMWPIFNVSSSAPDQYNAYLTPFDQLIHFCASMGQNPGGVYPRHEYIFKRERADSAEYDFRQIPRNQDLLAYLYAMMGRPVPGYNASFVDKYDQEGVVQLLAMVYDYIRSTNLHDDTLFPAEEFAQAFQQNNTSDFPTFTNPRDFNEKGFGHKGHGQVTPIRIELNGIEGTGMGRFFTLSGADIHAICAGMPTSLDRSLYPGVTQYARGVVEPPSGRLFSNLPPLSGGAMLAGRGNPTTDPFTDPDKANWPLWLKELEQAAQNSAADPAVQALLFEEVQAAFDPAQWNWQLAFLDSGYRDAVLADPTRNKFNPNAISDINGNSLRLEGWRTPLNPNDDEILVQASFLFHLFSPSIGWGSINPDMEIRIEKRGPGLTFNSTGLNRQEGFLGFEDPPGYTDGDRFPNTFVWATNWAKPHRQGGARSWGGLLSFGYTMSAAQPLQPAGQRQLWSQMARTGRTLNHGIRSRLTPLDKGYNQIPNALREVAQAREIGGDPDVIAQAYRYDLVTFPFKIRRQPNGLVFNGGNVRFEIFSGGQHTEASARKSPPESVQRIELEFPSFRVNPPAMEPGGFMGWINEFNALSHDSHNSVELASVTADPGNPISTNRSKATRRPGTGRTVNSANEGRTDNRGRMAHLVNHWDHNATYIRPGDVVQSICVPHGDIRIPASMADITPADGVYAPHRNYGNVQMAHSLTNSVGVGIWGFNPGAADNREFLIIPDLPETMVPHRPGRRVEPYRDRIPMPFGTLRSRDVQLYGDFDNGSGTMIDGPYINKPDEGNVHSLRTRFTQEVVDYWEQRRNFGEFPYFSNPEFAEAGGPAYFSPNRMISGPGMLGSLPTSLRSSPPRPWQTLLFRPNVEGNGYASHPGAQILSDHLLMDFFWMPVVEPYAISEPLSTAGKINMNFQIVPFLHVERNTALRGVFRSEFMLCVPREWHHSYKHDRGRGEGYHWRDNPYGGALQGKRLRAAIVEDDTLMQFTQRFDSGRNAFKSATEICEIHLIPEEVSRRLGRGKGSIGTFTPTVDKMANGEYWRAHSLVGDNSRERPYANIHTRLTTKSNTFQVHYRAQIIKQARRQDDAEYAEWRPFTDSVQAEYRGSSIVERYVDPNANLPDFAVTIDQSIDDYYRFRVINPRRFAP